MTNEPNENHELLNTKEQLLIRLAYWEDELQNASCMLNADITVSEFTAICQRKHSARMKISSLQSRINRLSK
jgi:hypothetical protein